jgi:type I restriction enzyme S subunit
MKAGWQTATLGEVFSTVTGNTPPKNNPLFYGQYMPLVKPPELCNATLDSAEDGLSEVGADVSRTAPPNSILVSCIGNLGKVGLNTIPVAFNQQINAILPDIKKAIPEFMFYQVLSSSFRDQLESLASGTTVPIVNKSKFNSIQIVLPPILEQQCIVGILDEAFEGIATAKANAEQNLQNARALFQSHLQSVLSSNKWELKTLGDVCESVEYGSSAKSKQEGEIPVLRMGNIQDGKLNWEKLVYTSDKEEIKKYLLQDNDVLFNRTNSPELVGKTAIYKSEMPAIFAGYLIRIHRKEDLLDADYLNYFLNSQIALDYGKTVVISSVNQANINGTKLKGYPIPIPSLSEQKIIVKKLGGLHEEIQRLESLYQRKLAAVAELKKSLLHQAFSGAL